MDRALSQAVIDHNELDATEISPRVAKLLSWSFVVLLASVPLSQTAFELWHGNHPQVLDVFQPLYEGARMAAGGQWHEARKAWLSGLERPNLRAYEQKVEAASIAKSLFQPRVQELLTAYGGFGNDKAIAGREGWLYYQPGWAYVVGQSVLDKSYLARQLKRMVDKGEESNPEPDPRPALLGLNESCRKAGIHLLVLPIPDKVMLQPRELTRGVNSYAGTTIPNNSGYAALEAELKGKGVDVLDVWPSSVKPDETRYLQQDTHWTPEFMESVADVTAAHIGATAAIGKQAAAGRFRVVDEAVSRVGDLVDMLKMTRTQKVYTPQTVRIRQIVDEHTGRPVQPDGESDVLLIGDSFTNIFSLPEMGWGQGAGFAEQLAYRLGRPLDVIALNGGGVWRARSELARPENAGRLGWKKFIIYEFAIRDLSGENWKVVPMVTPIRPVKPAAETTPGAPISAPERTPGEGSAVKKTVHADAAPAIAAIKPADAGPLVVTGKIVKTSRVPAPGTAPYKDCLTFVMVQVEQVISGNYKAPELIAAFWAMKDNVWLPAASYAVGDRLKLTLIPLNKAEPQIRSMQRADDLDDYTHQPLFVTKEGN